MMMIIGRPLVPRAVARPGRALLYHVVRHSLQIVRPTDSSEKIYERGRHVGAVVAQLTGLVVPRKYVVIIVPALAKGGKTYAQAISRADGAAMKHYNIIGRLFARLHTSNFQFTSYSLVVRSHAVHVSRGVYQPRQMQRERVSE